jgi:ketosteroid isomerase-like protein
LRFRLLAQPLDPSRNAHQSGSGLSFGAPRKKIMRKCGIAPVLLLLLVVVLSALSCSARHTSAVDTVRECLRAVEAMDVDRFLSYFADDAQMSATDIALSRQMLDMVDYVAIGNLNLSVLSETESRASVAAEYDIEIKMQGGEPFVQRLGQSLELESTDGRWLITNLESSTLE